MDSRFHKVVAISEWTRGIVNCTHMAMEMAMAMDSPEKQSFEITFC